MQNERVVARSFCLQPPLMYICPNRQITDMKPRIFTITFLLAVMTVTACSTCSSHPDGTPDYSSPSMWYTGGSEATQTNADIFYIAPTCNWGWTDASGTEHHIMDVNDPAQIANLQAPLKLAEKVFADDSRFYSPYYRQITMETWFESDEVIEQYFTTAMNDIEKAFDYYMSHINEGRPFILAGHSQGGKCVVELLKDLDKETYDRLVAAYVVGFEVTDEDLRSPYIVPATDADATGVTICFNSAASPAAASPLFSDNRICINPMNWTTDATVSLPSDNLGTVFLNADGSIAEEISPVTTHIDPTSLTVIVDGLDPELYYIPSISAIAPLGNYHVQELNIYFGNLRDNVARRTATYYSEL